MSLLYVNPRYSSPFTHRLFQASHLQMRFTGYGTPSCWYFTSAKLQFKTCSPCLRQLWQSHSLPWKPAECGSWRTYLLKDA
jgi:hypothetical protein